MIAVEVELVGGPFCGDITIVKGERNKVPTGVVIHRPPFTAVYADSGRLTSAGRAAYRCESTYRKEPAS